MLSWSRIVVFVAAAAAAAGTARLGLWQLDRAEQKLRAQAEIDRRERLPPLTLAELARQPAQLAAQRQRRAEVEGRWLNRWTLYLDNRAMDGRAGFIVLTPLALDDGSALLVERGWVARDFHDRTRVRRRRTSPGACRCMAGSSMGQRGCSSSTLRPAERSGRMSICANWRAKPGSICARCRCDRLVRTRLPCCATGRVPIPAWPRTMAMPSSGLRFVR